MIAAMYRSVSALLSLVAFLISAGAAAAETTVVRFGELVRGRGQVVRDAVVVIEGERITKVGSSEITIPANAKVIDLRRFTGIPGMIDVHTHMTFYWDRAPGTRPWTQLGTLGPAVTVFLAQENARKTLESGVTTVRDLGSWEYTDIAMRNLINRGAMTGPRMFVAANGLHITAEPYRPGVVQPDPGRADGVAEVQRVARQRCQRIFERVR
jgi:imidazolonepropionase-like amidohydrolase